MRKVTSREGGGFVSKHLEIHYSPLFDLTLWFLKVKRRFSYFPTSLFTCPQFISAWTFLDWSKQLSRKNTAASVCQLLQVRLVLFDLLYLKYTCDFSSIYSKMYLGVSILGAVKKSLPKSIFYPSPFISHFVTFCFDFIRGMVWLLQKLHGKEKCIENLNDR